MEIYEINRMIYLHLRREGRFLSEMKLHSKKTECFRKCLSMQGLHTTFHLPSFSSKKIRPFSNYQGCYGLNVLKKRTTLSSRYIGKSKSAVCLNRFSFSNIFLKQEVTKVKFLSTRSKGTSSRSVDSTFSKDNDQLDTFSLSDMNLPDGKFKKGKEEDMIDSTENLGVSSVDGPDIDDPNKICIHVNAFYVGRGLDVVKIVTENFLSSHHGYRLQERLVYVPLERTFFPKLNKTIVTSAFVIFRFGSIVFFNVSERMQSQYLYAVVRHCSELVPVGERFRDELDIFLEPDMVKFHEMAQDLVKLRDINEDTMKIISDVMGHSVAINYYNNRAETFIHDFRLLNNSVESSGEFTEMEKKDLFKLVAMNNKILTDAMSSGLLDESKVAWEFNELDALWSDLREEFNIGSRYNKVEHKIIHVQTNTKFFLEILNHQKSNKLEWIIIVLIAIEIVLSTVDLSNQFFGPFTAQDFIPDFMKSYFGIGEDRVQYRDETLSQTTSTENVSNEP